MADVPSRRNRGTALWIGALALGGAVILVSPFLPWVTASSPALGTASLTGLEGGRGVPAVLIAGAVAVAVGVALLLAVGGKGARRLLLQLGVLAGMVAGVVTWFAVRDAADPAVSLLVSRDEPAVSYAPGIGVWMLLAGSALVLAGSIGAGVGRRVWGRTTASDVGRESA
jgi:hypothetical protein